MFKILKKDKNSKARLGVLKTAHGVIKTPAYVFVGTYGKILHLTPKDIKKTKTQIIIANTFHLWNRVNNSKSVIRNSIIGKLGNLPLMTDSGGFQVLSLAFSDRNKAGKFMTGSPDKNTRLKRDKIKITSRGVYFTFDGKKKFLGPELSIKLQHKIGADIIFAFDHITSPLDTYEYNKRALELTNKWAKICLKSHESNVNGQLLFGIVQGGLFKDLRIQSAKSIGSMPFDGFGIGGSYTKKQIAKVLKWIIPHLPEEKPRHLLGVGKVEDIFEAVENGVDTFDCVIPTREARHGRLYTKKGTIDIRRGYFAKPGSEFSEIKKRGKAAIGKSTSWKEQIEPGCKCPTCSAKIPKWKIRELIKSPNRTNNASGQRFCLMHNMWFFNKLLEDIRTSIQKNKYAQFKKQFLTKFK